jgi:hypothetical protein
MVAKSKDREDYGFNVVLKAYAEMAFESLIKISDL